MKECPACRSMVYKTAVNCPFCGFQFENIAFNEEVGDRVNPPFEDNGQNYQEPAHNEYCRDDNRAENRQEETAHTSSQTEYDREMEDESYNPKNPKVHKISYYEDPYNRVSLPKSRMVAGFLGLLFGFLGVHNFYLGYTKNALIQFSISLISIFLTPYTGFSIFFIIIPFLWGLIEGLMILLDKLYVFDAMGNRIE